MTEGQYRLSNWLENFCHHFIQNISLFIFKYCGANISPTETCTKSRIETLEKGVKHVQSKR